MERVQTLCCCLHSLVPRHYRHLLFGGAVAGWVDEGRQQQWERGEEDEEEEEDENYNEYGEGALEGGEGGMYEMVPPSLQAADDDVCLLMGPAGGVKLQNSAGAAQAPALPATFLVAAKGTEHRERRGGRMTTIQKRGEKMRVGKEEEVKEEEQEGGQEQNVPHECVICLEEFTRENPEMHTRK